MGSGDGDLLDKLPQDGTEMTLVGQALSAAEEEELHGLQQAKKIGHME